MSYIRIFNQDGYELVGIQADADRSWVIGKYGRCEFTIPIISAKCRERYLNFGNYVLIEHPSLPPWGGMIDPPRKWGNNKVMVTAYTPEYILYYRNIGFGNLTTTEGGLFKYAIDQANKVDATRLFKSNPIDESGTSVSYELRYENIYDYLRSKLTYEWHFAPVVEGGRIYFEGSLYEEIVNPFDFSLTNGINIEESDETLTEDGKIYTAYKGIGKGSSWSARYVYDQEDKEAGGKYGYRIGTVEVDSKDHSTVEEDTGKTLAANKQPQKVFDLSAIDGDLDTFKYINLGNVLHANLSVCGFSGDKIGITTDVRITGMTYLENKGVVRLICEEYDES